jgi:hypothetical protein
MAVARAELWDAVQGGPASWAVLEIHYNGRFLGRGIADEMGRVAVIFPYPAPRASPFTSPLGSPPAGSGRPLFSQEWSLELRVFYSPPLASPLEQAEAALPDLHSALGQKQAVLWGDLALTTPVTEAVLGYGRELILRSRDDGVSPPARASVLFITPA